MKKYVCVTVKRDNPFAPVKKRFFMAEEYVPTTTKHGESKYFVTEGFAVPGGLSFDGPREKPHQSWEDTRTVGEWVEMSSETEYGDEIMWWQYRAVDPLWYHPKHKWLERNRPCRSLLRPV